LEPAVATHHLESTSETSIDILSPDLPPVLTVTPGDTVVVHTLDSGGFFERPPATGEKRPQLIENLRGHCLVGPIAVEGTEPGQVLAVHFVSLLPDDWGLTGAGVADTPLNRRLGFDGSNGTRLLWDLDVEAGVGTNQLGLSTALKPFLGVVAMTPSEPGEHSTVPPRTLGAGNIDCRELVAGSTLYIPVTVPGALLSVGDGHAAQGDGEVSGTAIEAGMTTEMILDIEPDPALSTVHAITPVGRITFGFNADLNEATVDALDAMLTWMQKLYSITKAEALGMASTTVSLRVTQIANDTWGVHALLPDGAITVARQS
jgi:acetamidase/formamidase